MMAQVVCEAVGVTIRVAGSQIHAGRVEARS
jgi:hypothetical protein